MLTLVAAGASLAPAGARRLRPRCWPGVLALAAFVIANPYAVLDSARSATGSATSPRRRATAAASSASRPTAGSSTTSAPPPGGWAGCPLLAALGGAVGAARPRPRGSRAVLVPAPLVFLRLHGHQDRFFARWLLPVYPLLCLLAAWAVVGAAGLGARPRRALAAARRLGGCCCACRGSCSRVHNDLVLARDDTRQLARDWMVDNVPIRSKVVVEPFVPAAWAADARASREGTGNGFRWNKWPTTARAPDARWAAA